MDAVRRAIKTVSGVNADLSIAGGTSDGRFIADVCPWEFGPVNATLGGGEGLVISIDS